jgi:hypothetical protein
LTFQPKGKKPEERGSAKEKNKRRKEGQNGLGREEEKEKKRWARKRN